MTTPTRMVRKDPDFSNESYLPRLFPKPSVSNLAIRVVSTFYITLFAKEKTWDFTPENYSLDRLQMPQFPGVNGEKLSHNGPTTDLSQMNAANGSAAVDVSLGSRLQGVEAYTKEVFLQHPEASLAATVTALTGMYAVLLGSRMPHAKTRMPTAFLLAAATTYGIANYAFACSISQQIGINAMVNSIASNVLVTLAAPPLEFIAGVSKEWPGQSLSVSKKEI